MARPRRPRDPIQAVGTSVAAFVGSLPGGPPAAPVFITSVLDFERAFGSAEGETADAVRLFFENGGRQAYVAGLNEADPRHSLEGLSWTSFDLLVIPATARLQQSQATSLAVAAALFAEDKRAFYLVDPPAERTVRNVARWAGSFGGGRSSAVYFPRLRVRRPSGERDVPAAGAVAGILARTDITRGVWVSSAGERVDGTLGPSLELDDATVEKLDLASVNSIRRLPGRGVRVWGARTRADTDSEWQYVNVRRLAAFLEQSIEHGLQWVVFEPNRPRLWTQVRAQVRAFLQVTFRQGAFSAAKPEDAFFVRCDRTTMTQDEIDSGRLNIHVGIAPLRPAEFVVVRIGLWARPSEDDD
jgi:phage tail sheath protein FI